AEIDGKLDVERLVEAILAADLRDLGGRGIFSGERCRRVGWHHPDQEEGENQETDKGWDHQQEAAQYEAQHGNPSFPFSLPERPLATSAPRAPHQLPKRVPCGSLSPLGPAPLVQTPCADPLAPTPCASDRTRQGSSSTQRISPPDPTGENRK